MNHIVALSGGKDSTAMALRLSEIEPREYQYVITPTGDELPEMIAHWKRLGEILGSPLKVISGGHSLNKLIREYGALPNWRQRWCTRQIKIEPFNQYLLTQTPATAYVGLRFDEPEEERKGVNYGGVEGIQQRFPLREWEWSKSNVFEYLDCKGVRVPLRTDCARCYHQRIGEWYRLWRDHIKIYLEAEAQEIETGHTFRGPNRDSWPAALVELRAEFEKGRFPRGENQYNLFASDREGMCSVCRM